MRIALLLCLLFVACESLGFSERECKRICGAMKPAHVGSVVRDHAGTPSFARTESRECRCWLWARDLPSPTVTEPPKAPAPKGAPTDAR